MNGKSPMPAHGFRPSRREFLGAAGAAALTAMLPAISAPPSHAASPAVGARIADGGADDVWGVYPRYAEPIAFAKTRSGGAPVVEPLEAL